VRPFAFAELDKPDPLDRVLGAAGAATLRAKLGECTDSVTTSVQGGEPGIITLNMHYEKFAPLDGPPPMAKTLGPQGTAAFLAKGAGLSNQLDQSILQRVAGPQLLATAALA
jgi:hypothetical protein